LHGIVDCLWVIGVPISGFKEAMERETGILTEVDSYDWIAFLPQAYGSGAYNRYFGRLDTGKIKIQGVMTCKGDTPEYVRRIQQELFEVLGQARSREELQRVEPQAREIARRYRDGLREAEEAGYPPQGGQAQILPPVCRGLGGASLHEGDNQAGSGDGYSLCNKRHRSFGCKAKEDSKGIRFRISQETAGEGLDGEGICVT